MRNLDSRRKVEQCHQPGCREGLSSNRETNVAALVGTPVSNRGRERKIVRRRALYIEANPHVLTNRVCFCVCANCHCPAVTAARVSAAIRLRISRIRHRTYYTAVHTLLQKNKKMFIYDDERGCRPRLFFSLFLQSTA